MSDFQRWIHILLRILGVICMFLGILIVLVTFQNLSQIRVSSLLLGVVLIGLGISPWVRL